MSRKSSGVKSRLHVLTSTKADHLQDRLEVPGLRPYDCRHCAITNLLQNPDVSEETVKAIAGHVSPEILKTYSHIRLEAKQTALDALVRKSFKGNPR